jgi:PAS domain S-box-containing protein
MSFAMQIALGYAFCATLWIVFSDTLLVRFAPDTAFLTTAESFKDGAFVGLTSLLLYVGLVREQRRRSASENELRRLNNALREREERFRLLAEQAQDIVYRFRISEPRGFEFVSPAATAITGYTPEEHYADPDLGFKLVHQDDRPLLEQLAAGAGMDSLVLRWVRKDGAIIWTEQKNTPIFDSTGTLVAIEGIARDITRRKETELKLQQVSQLLQSVFTSLRDALLLVNPYTRLIQDCNPAAAAIFGYTRDELIGQTTHGLHVDEAAFERFGNAALVAYDQVGYFEGEYVMKRRNGEIFPTEHFVRPIYDEHGTLMVVVSVVRDITGRKQAENDLHQALAELQMGRERLQRLSQLLLEAHENERRHIARELHDEIGQALGALKINLFMLSMPSEPDLFALRLHESAKIVDDLIQQVRALSLDLRPAVLDDLGLAAALEWYTGRVAQRTGLEITFNDELGRQAVPPATATTCFRVAQEALTNIVRHAMACQVTVGMHHSDGRLVLSVSDDGVGFDVARQRGRAAGGASLGMLSMQERVDLIGGSIDITSAPGRGTRVVARFPLDA